MREAIKDINRLAHMLDAIKVIQKDLQPLKEQLLKYMDEKDSNSDRLPEAYDERRPAPASGLPACRKSPNAGRH